MSDYDVYFANLAKVKRGEPATIRDHNQPDAGFYRGKNMQKELVGYAYWYEDGRLKCELNGKPIAELRALQTWPYVGSKPIEQEWYFGFVETGKWPDVSDAALQNRADNRNGNPDIDPDSVEGMTAQLDRLEKEGRELAAKGIPTEKVAADVLANIKNDAGRLETAFEAKRRAECIPLERDIAAVNGKWKPLSIRAEQLKVDIQKIVTLYITAEDNRRKAAAAAAEAERQKKLALARQQNAPVDESLEKPIEATAVKVGSHGRRVSNRTVWAYEITDRAALLKHCENMPAVQEALEKIASSFTKGARPEIPGLKYIEDKKAV
jgi:hypothetical protein